MLEVLELLARANCFFLSQQMVKRPCVKQDVTISFGVRHNRSRSPSPLYLYLLSWHHFPTTPRRVNLVSLNLLTNHPLLPRPPLPSLQQLHPLWPWISRYNCNEQNITTCATWNYRKGTYHFTAVMLYTYVTNYYQCKRSGRAQLSRRTKQHL